MSTSIKKIYIYPIKSLAGIELEKCYITKHGISHPLNKQVVDRKWMIVDENGSFQTQRQISKMALIKPEIAGDSMILSAPGQADLKVPIEQPSKKIMCRVWNCKISGFVYGDDVRKWLSTFLEKENLNLVTFGNNLDEETRKVLTIDTTPACHAKESDSTIYADASSFMLLSDSSVEDLNSKLEKKVTVANFRPNFYVNGCEKPYEEDEWLNFKIGSVSFNKIKHCTRCVLTTVDPNNGVRDPKMEPLNTLKTFRTNKELYGTSPMFGIHCALHDNSQKDLEININDKINHF